jgi:arylsulfatase A
MKRLTLLLATFCMVQSSFSVPPNILLVLVDDMGYGDPRCFNPESKIATPHIDKLAAEGMRFTDAHAGGSICVPSRYSLLSGRMPYRNWNAASA